MEAYINNIYFDKERTNSDHVNCFVPKIGNNGLREHATLILNFKVRGHGYITVDPFLSSVLGKYKIKANSKPISISKETEIKLYYIYFYSFIVF